MVKCNFLSFFSFIYLFITIDLFFEVIDLQLQELNNRFSEVTIELLLCMVCLNPSDSFLAFDIKKLTRLAKFYPSDFSETNVLAIDNQF